MNRLLRNGRAVLAVTVVALYCLPLYLAVVNVFKRPEDITAMPASLPQPITLGNLANVISSPDTDLWPTLARTAALTAVSIGLVLAIGSALGYYLGRHDGPFQRALTVVMVLGLAVPFQVILIPFSQVLRAIGLFNTYPGLILFNVGFYVPFAVILFSRLVRSIPRELDEAAAIDGAGPVHIFYRIILPLMRPASASVAIFVAVWVWNDFVNPLILLGPATGTTVMTGLYRTIGQYTADYGTTFAYMFVASLPLLVLFLALQQRFVSGLTAGATKG